MVFMVRSVYFGIIFFSLKLESSEEERDFFFVNRLNKS